MFKKHTARKSSNPLFMLFRLILSLTMFVLLLGGAYSAYKHFSGLDPLKLDPTAVAKNILGVKNPEQFLAVLSKVKVGNPLQAGRESSGLSSKKEQAAGQTSQQHLENPIFRFALIADSHNDNANLRRAIAQVKATHPDIEFIIGLGDYTDIGTTSELKKAKVEFDGSGVRYFLVAGDHDLWDGRDKNLDPGTNFRQVFGPTYQSFTAKGYRFLLIHNSDNYLGILEEQKEWINQELERAKTEGNKGIFAFMHEPLFHPSSDHYMGKVEKDLKTQAESLIFELKSAGVKRVFSGDTHYFSQYEEPVTKLPMVTVGALVTGRNPQLPRFAIVSVYEDGLTKVEDVELK